jgi:hypothetical protein
MKKTVTKLLILTIAFTFALSVNYLFAAWVGPTQAPPGGNTPAPVHVGLITQTKDGGLIVGALRSLLDVYVDGKVGIGTTNPSEALEVAGGAKVSEGLQVGNTTNANAGTIRWSGTDLEVYNGSVWVSLTAGGGGGGSGVCPAGQDSVKFGGASICLTEGATADAKCLSKFLDINTNIWAYSEGQARYSNGKIQTRATGGSTYTGSCDSKWVDGNYAECIGNSGIKSTVTTNINGIILSATGGIASIGTSEKIGDFSCYEIGAWK